jgi:hypothetical protein
MPAFTARIEKHWIMRCVIAPAAVVRALGGGQRIPVVARYAGEVVTTTLMPAGRGRGRLTVLADILRRAQLDVGDRLEVELTPSSDPRDPAAPADLQRALHFRPAAQAAFTRGPASVRRWMVQYLEEARRPETRQKRLELLLERLAERAARKKR